jgi:endoglucanase
LPIDLDLFVEQRTFEGDAVNLEVSDDLFTVIDAFDTWTAEQGLGLTLDYHQYDKSLDFGDPESLAVMVELWRLVAAHLADNPRTDLFLELLNEPEQSAIDSHPPSSTEWTALATDMIAAIRASDTTHTIIFGDRLWYGIGALSARTPFTDPNVVYAFHFYEPFIFTHQGASWTDMASVHDIPYPYSVDRWSEYSIDFGFTPLIAAWERSQLEDYATLGTKSWVRNQIAAAKAWAVAHQVPVLCNEFGAYDGASSLEDRARYYADLRDIFAELEIPWQIWFMIMDPETGAVDPAYRDALGLGD